MTVPENLHLVDVDLAERDVQTLASADAVAALFARLGYRTEARLKQSLANLGITANGTARPVKRVELIAEHEGLLQVYLFELTSVTVSHTRALARAFRNRAGNYMLVLTSDYERIDFVLVERLDPKTGKGRGIGQRQVGIRPRVLTVERRKPGRIRLRVLRRFTYTEPDPIAQYEKLLSAFAIADWSSDFFNNRALFSDYYLTDKKRLKDHPFWEDDPKPAFKALRELFHGAAGRWAGQEEHAIRSGLLEPALRVLGFAPKQEKAPGDASLEPDYRLHADGRNGGPLAVCLTYPWGRSLDRKDDRRDNETPDENPGAVVVSILSRGDAPWAVVTNGKIWRLYSAKTHSRATNYYEIDLEETLAHGDPGESFKYFWLFFRREAFELVEFEREGERHRAPFLDYLLGESQDYAKELGERLKKCIFEEVFPHLARGFVEHIRHRKGKADLSQPALDRIFGGTLTFLYRVLFLLYAEARDLLPAREVRGYHGKSITRLKREIADNAEAISDQVEKKLKKHYRPDAYGLYDRLTELFAIIDRGDAKLNVPTYNGGLFITEPDPDDDTHEAEHARFLSKHKIPDLFLAQGLDLVARGIDSKRQDLVPVDYKSLGVRQLGSIYEGLLEFKLRIAPRKMAVVKGKKTEEVVPYRQAKAQKRKMLKIGRGKKAKERVIKKGELYLENDKRERKATGSYYTPDHIVKYIVENAVGPVLEEKFNEVRPRLRDAQKAYHDAVKRADAMTKQGMKPSDPEKVANTFRDVVGELFSLRVLDPAMGSGHFLVEAVDLVTDRMIDFLNGFRPWNPVYALMERTRRTILESAEEQGITLNAERLDDLNLLKRHVLKRCIYGVDLNPMAVELAKVSLWLDCFTLGAPLSFLDHHLKCGNSLIGVTVGEVEEALQEKQQLTLFQKSGFSRMLLAVDLMRKIGELSDVTPQMVKESRRKFRKAFDALKPARTVMDVYTSRWFGNEPVMVEERAITATRSGRTGSKWVKVEHDITTEFLKAADAEAWLKGEEPLKALDERDRRIVDTALGAARGRRFFHWDIEFAEVFFGPREGTTQVVERKRNSGFDAVVGNPPWGAELPDKAKPWHREHYATGTKGVLDNFALFLERFTESARVGGSIGILLPDIFLLKNYPLARKYALDNHQVKDAIHWGQPFPEVNLDVCSVLAKRQKKVPGDVPIRCIVDIISWDKGEYTENQVLHGTFRANEAFKFNLYLNSRLQRMLSKVDARSYPLGKFLKFHEGVHSGNIRSKLFVDHRCSRRCRPLIFGRDEVQPFHLRWAGMYVVYDRRIVDKAAGEYANLAHESYFTEPKLLVRRTGDRIIAVTDREGFFASNNLFTGQPRSEDSLPLEFFEGLLNSRLSTWYFRSIQPRVGRLFSELKIVHLERFPVPRVLVEQEADTVVDIVKSLRTCLQKASGHWDESARSGLADLERLVGEAAGFGKQELDAAGKSE